MTRKLFKKFFFTRIFLLMLIVVLINITSAYFNSSRADVIGGDVAILSKIYAQTLEEVDLLTKQVDTLKKANDTIVDVKDTIKALKDEYDFATNFSMDKVVEDILGDIDDATYLNELLDAEDSMSKYDYLMAMVDKRFTEEPGNKSPHNKVPKEQLKKMIDSLETLIKLKEHFATLALTSNTANSGNTKDILLRLTTSNEMMATAHLEEKIEKLEQELEFKKERMMAIQRDISFLGYLRGKKGA